MINKNTFEELEQIDVGCSLDRLELYLQELRDSYYLKCNIDQLEQFNRLKNILQKINPQSKILSSTVDTTITDLNRGQQLTKQKEQLDSSGIEQGVDITATVRCEGVDITLEYNNGRFYQAYTVIDKQVKDLTEKMLGIVPEYVEDWEDVSNTTIIGRVAISTANLNKVRQLGFKNINHATVHFVVQKDFSQVKNLIRFIAYSFQEQDSNEDINSIWDSLNTLKVLGFEVPQKIKARGIKQANLEQAVEKIVNRFDNLDRADEIQYKYSGVYFQADDIRLRDEYGISWIMGNSDNDCGEVLSIKVKDIKWENYGREYRAKIQFNPVQLRDGSYLEELDNITFRVIDRNNIQAGQRLKVRVNIDSNSDKYKITLCDLYGKALQ